MSVEFKEIFDRIFKNNNIMMNSIADKHLQINSKLLLFKKFAFEKLIKVKCVENINILEKYGNLVLDQHLILLNDIHDEDDKFEEAQSNFFKCAQENDNGLFNLTDEISKDINQINASFYENLEKCQSNLLDIKFTEECIDKTIKESVRNIIQAYDFHYEKIIKTENQINSLNLMI